MNTSWKYFSLGIVLLAAIPLVSQTAKDNTDPAAPTHKQTSNGSAQPAKEHDGQKVWEQNCSRCHNAPQGFSSHISGTVTRHMRVRAGLSEQDEKALRRFLNP
jgi:cytochrome c5